MLTERNLCVSVPSIGYPYSLTSIHVVDWDLAPIDYGMEVSVLGITITS